MATLDSSIVNIALPVISKELFINISSVQWVVTSYLLTISVLLLIWGKISDLYGRKRIFAAGFIVFTVGSILCGLSNSLGMLVFSRVLQAIGASSMMALSQGIVTGTFPPNERGKALGITGTTVAIGSLVGPSLGGILVHTSGWQSIFFINIPVGILGTILTFAIIPEVEKKPDSKAFDFKGASMFVPSLILLFTGLLLFQEGAIGVYHLIPAILVSVVVLYLFARYESRIEQPLINLSLFKSPVFSLGIASGYLSFIAIYATILFMPFYLQNVLNLSSLTAGLLMSFYPAATAIVAPVSGWLSDKITFRPLTIAGLLISTIILFILSTLNATSSFSHIAVLMSLMGAGMALFQSPNTSSIMGSVPRNQLGIAGGINALFRNLGMVSGITISVILFNLATRININNLSGNNTTIDPVLFLKGFKVVFITAGLVCLCASVFNFKRSRH